MKSILALSRITILEVIHMRVYQILAAAILLLPIIAIVFSNIFIFDIGKVRIDVFAAGTQLLITAYILFIAVSLLGRDISQKTCYQFLMPPVSRQTYLSGRFVGLLAGLFLLICICILSGELLITFTLSDTAKAYQSGISHGTGVSLALLSSYQYISLLALIFFICSWASGLTEMLVFSITAIFLTWILPPIIQALQTTEVLQQTPAFITFLTQIISTTLPRLNGAEIGLALAHGVSINSTDIILHLVEHSGYTCLMFGLALFIFSRRDL